MLRKIARDIGLTVDQLLGLSTNRR